MTPRAGATVLAAASPSLGVLISLDDVVVLDLDSLVDCDVDSDSDLDSDPVVVEVPLTITNELTDEGTEDVIRVDISVVVPLTMEVAGVGSEVWIVACQVEDPRAGSTEEGISVGKGLVMICVLAIREEKWGVLGTQPP
jgi:hypothetical protein